MPLTTGPSKDTVVTPLSLTLQIRKISWSLELYAIVFCLLLNAKTPKTGAKANVHYW